MNHRHSIIAFAVVISAGLATAAGAADKDIDRLVTARQKVARAADETKGAPRLWRLQQRAQLSDLIDRLESGRSVKPAEIDRALQDAERQSY